MYEKTEPSVWRIASITICIAVVIMFLAGAFNGGDAVVAVVAQQ